MKKAFTLSLVAGLLMVAGMFVLGVDPASAAETFRASALPHFSWADAIQASPVLIALRRDLDGLVSRAADKLAEIKDDTSPEAARSIQDEHAGLLEQIEAKRTEIAEEERRQPPTPVQQPDHAGRAAEIVGIAAQARAAGVELTVEEEQTAIRGNVDAATFRSQMFERLAARSSSTPTNPARVLRDERETRREAMTEALSYRFGAPLPQAGPSAGAREYMQRGLVDIAAASVEYRGGIMLNARQIDEIFTRASHTTSDFPIIFEGAINRTLQGRYALAQPTFRRIARRADFRDFRPHATVNLGDFPMLEKVLEAGEIKYGTFTEGKETVRAYSYARALNVTRQMLINDDIGAIEDLLSSYGSTVALFEEILFYAEAFNASLADGKAVFHADHGNLAGSGTVIDVANVGKARAAMSKQKTPGGNPMLQNSARIMLVGPDKLTEAEMLVASITPATMANVNIFSGRFDVVESSQLSGNAWYTFADPQMGSNYRWGYLQGYEAPRVRTEEPFGRQGFAMSVEHDFGVGAVDHRFGYKNPGA